MRLQIEVKVGSPVRLRIEDDGTSVESDILPDYGQGSAVLEIRLAVVYLDMFGIHVFDRNYSSPAKYFFFA